MITVGLWFGIFQAVMPLMGYYLGSLFSTFFKKYSHIIALILLSIIGINMIREAIVSDDEDVEGSLEPLTMLFLAIATSIDAFLCGFSFVTIKINIFVAVSIIGIITFGFSALGIKLGSIFGDKLKNKAQILGGVILILLGLKIFIVG